MVNVDAELSKHKNCKNRDELSKLIKGYKDLALQHASNMLLAGQYTMVAHKLQEICDKLPAPNLKRPAAGTSGTQVKTATITNEENAKINAAWKQKAGTPRKDDKR